MYTKQSEVPWNQIFWITHFVSMTGLILPLFLMTPMVEGFTFEFFHNTVSILEYVVVFFSLAGFRSILNKYIVWEDINYLEVLKVIVFAIISGVLMQYAVYYSLHMVTDIFFPKNKIPHMYFGGEELRIMNSVLKTFSWIFGFFTIKLMINYNAFKINGIALLSEVKQEEINAIGSRIDANFMTDSIELTKNLVLEDIEKARDTLTELSNVLRYSLTQEYMEYVKIQDELIIINDYFKLKQGHCGKRINYTTNIPKHYLDEYVPPMKFMNVIKKLISCHTISVDISIKQINDSSRVQIEIANANEINDDIDISKELLALYSKEENLDIINLANETKISFDLLSTQLNDQKISSYE